MKHFRISLCILLMLACLCSCGKKKQEDYTAPAVSYPETTVPVETTTKKVEKTTAESTKPQSTAPAAVSTETTEYEAQYGDSQLDFDTDNKFVDAVVAKYGIDREGLITAYSVKGRDSNYVWQFNGSRDENGKLIRNADTLKYVYYVNADCSKVSRTGGYTGNDGCTLKDGLTVFLLTQKVLIPNLQEQIDRNS